MLEELGGGATLERRDGKDVLAGEMQHGTARHQEHQSRRAGEQLDERGRGGTQVLDVVQDEQELPVADRCSEPVERRLAGRLRDADRSRNRWQQELGIAQGRELDDRSAVGERRRGQVSGRQCETRLAAASRPGEDEQPHVATREQSGQRLQLPLAPEEGVGRLRERTRGVHGRFARVERRILLEDAAMQLAKLRAWLQPELVVHPPPKLGVVVERVGLATGAIEGQHREALYAFPQGLISCHRERIGKHLVVPAELQRRIEPRLQGNQPKLLEPLRLGAREAVVHHVGVGGAPPERQRASEVRAREGGVPLRQCLDSVVVKTLEPVGVE